MKLSAEIIELGKALVTHLSEEDGRRDDQLSKWMAHSIAAKMTAAQAAPLDIEIQNDCALAILQLWEHRAVFPHPKRPTDQYEAILRTLERLDPEHDQPFYLAERQVPVGDEGQWLRAAVGFDQAARVLIGYAIKQGAKCAEGGVDWRELVRTAGLSEPTDMKALRIILTGTGTENLDAKTAERKRLQALRAQLAFFQKMSRLVADALKSDIEALDASVPVEGDSTP